MKNSLIIAIILFIISVILSCEQEPDKSYVPPPNLSLKIGFPDTMFLLNYFSLEEIANGYLADSLLFYIDSEGVRQYQELV